MTYLGYDLDLQLKVAIKEYFPIGVCVRSSQSYNVITASAAEDHTVFSKGCEVFLDEARTLAKFNSPYIVHVRDFFREHGTAYIVMDFAEGITLKAEMKKNGGKLPYERILSLMKPMILQLEQLHLAGIIHRDIKPDNLMLVKDWQGEHLILLDFGSARTYVSKESKSMTSIVTHGFSPLEQYSSISRQGSFTDVYALCATIYNAITGIIPPSAGDRNIDGVEVKSIRASGVGIMPEIEAAIMHGLSLRSADRPQTMGQLSRELSLRNTSSAVPSVGDQTNSANREGKELTPPILQKEGANNADPIHGRLAENSDRKPGYWECECGYRGKSPFCLVCYKPRPHTGKSNKGENRAGSIHERLIENSDRKPDYWECVCGYRVKSPFCLVCYKPRPRTDRNHIG